MRPRFIPPEPSRTAPLPFAWSLGMLFGAAAGFDAGLWEHALLRAAGDPGPLGSTVLASASVGALCGLLGGISGLYGPYWSTAATVIAVGWVGSTVLGGGAYGAIGVAIGFAASVVAGQVLGRLTIPPQLHQGLAGFGFVVVAVLAPVEHHLISCPTTGGAVGVALLVLLAAAACGGLAGALTWEGRAPWGPLVGAAVAGLALVAIPRKAPPPLTTSASGPSFVLIVISGLRADRVGFLGYGAPTIVGSPTPILDEIARKGAVFEQAHATSNWTVPSLASMLTGRWPYGHGAGLNDGDHQRYTPLRADVRTVPEVLRREGFATAAVVADPTLRQYGFDHGFDRYLDDPGGGWMPTALAPLAAAGLHPWPRAADADAVVDRTIGVLHELPDHGSFLLIQLSDLAGPLTPTPGDLRVVGTTPRPYPSDRYDAALRRVDRALGRLLPAIPPDAWLAVAGDRGLSLGEARPEARQGDTRARFGGTMFEELLHVPLIVRAPSVSPVRERALVSVADLGPTIWRALRVDPPPELDGAALAPVFGEPETERPVLAQSALVGPEQQAVWLGHQKLVQYSERITPVFDLETDPTESTPIPPTGSKNAGAERRLSSLLPPRAAGSELVAPPPVALQIGQITERLLR